MSALNTINIQQINHKVFFHQQCIHTHNQLENKFIPLHNMYHLFEGVTVDDWINQVKVMKKLIFNHLKSCIRLVLRRFNIILMALLLIL